MANAKLVCAAAIIAVLAVMSAPASEAALSCGTVAGKLAPCINYAKGMGPPVGGCCSGIKSLKAMASSTADRQQACRCLQSAASSIKGLKFNLVQGLPAACKVNIPYKISPSTNCNTVR